jgi:PAS domain-containing protein
MAVMHNVSERRRAQQLLADSEELFGSFVENSPAMVYIKDSEGRYLRVNRICEEIQGCAAASLIGLREREVKGLNFELEVERMEAEVLSPAGAGGCSRSTGLPVAKRPTGGCCGFRSGYPPERCSLAPLEWT